MDAEQRARELLAQEIDQDSGAATPQAASNVREGKTAGVVTTSAALRVITRALTQAQPGWRGIESAPKDGTVVLLGYAGSHSEEGRWVGDASRNYWGETGWFATDDDVLCEHPSHPDAWMPLPAAPMPQQGESDKLNKAEKEQQGED